MRLIIALVLLNSILISPSCSADEPTCIDEMIEDFQILNDGRDFTGISTFDMNGETFYVFDSGVAFDATASVVNEECEQVCVYGGLRGNSPQPCDAFQEGINNSRQIWP